VLPQGGAWAPLSYHWCHGQLHSLLYSCPYDELMSCACRTKRFRKSGDVDFAQILGRGVRALDLEMSCDTHGSMGAHAQAGCPDPVSLLATLSSCLHWLDLLL
jgi:hypothetical protein